MPRLTIVIVTFNSAADIGTCLESIPAAARHTDYDVIVVDNASADGTAALVRERWPHVRVVDAGGNLGFARANNLGIRATAGELVLLLNPDAVPGDDAIDRLVAVLDEMPGVAVAGPRIVDEADTVQEVELEPAAAGVDLICRGLRRISPDDHAAVELGLTLYDALYAQLESEA